MDFKLFTNIPNLQSLQTPPRSRWTSFAMEQPRYPLEQRSSRPLS